MEDSAVDMFMKYDYAEMKDMLKTFITLVSASIVFSLTFSEKIIKFDHASSNTRRVIVTAWGLMIISLIIGGVSLFLIACAAGKIVYGAIPFIDIDSGYLEYLSVLTAISAGITYICSLIVLIFAVARAVPVQTTPLTEAAAAPKGPT